MSLSNDEGVPYSDKQLRDVVINFIIAGRDTTSLTLTWLFSMLSGSPRVVENILKETYAILEDLTNNCGPAANHHHSSRCSSAGDSMTTFAEFESLGITKDMYDFANLLNYQALNRMHYLHAAITEALRLYPAVPLVCEPDSGK
jgi:cytochrome P450